MWQMKLSVIIAVYNQEELIKKAIESIPKGCEIIVVDDCSIDNTVEEVKKYKYVKLIQNEKNKGVGLTRNIGLDAATGDYICFLDSDDYFYTKKLEEVMKFMGEYDVIFYNMKTNSGKEVKLTPLNYTFHCGMNKLMKKEFIKELRFPDRKHGEDWIFAGELAKLSGNYKFTDMVVYHYNYPRENSLCWLYERDMLNTKPKTRRVVATNVWEQKKVVDNEVGRIRLPGEKFFVDEERYKVLKGDNKYKLVFIKDSETKKQKEETKNE